MILLYDSKGDDYKWVELSSQQQIHPRRKRADPSFVKDLGIHNMNGFLPPPNHSEQTTCSYPVRDILGRNFCHSAVLRALKSSRV